MKHKTFYEAIYGAWVDFIWGCSASELKKYIGNKYDYVDNDTETFAGAVVRVISAGKDGLKKRNSRLRSMGCQGRYGLFRPRSHALGGEHFG